MHENGLRYRYMLKNGESVVWEEGPEQSRSISSYTGDMSVHVSMCSVCVCVCVCVCVSGVNDDKEVS